MPYNKLSVPDHQLRICFVYKLKFYLNRSGRSRQKQICSNRFIVPVNWITDLRSTINQRIMHLSEKCTVCETSLKYGEVVELRPCKDFVHKRCYGFISEDTPISMTCPWCGEAVDQVVDFVRRTYKRHPLRDRQMVVEAAEANKDWLQICDVLGVNRNTAESWIKAGRSAPLAKGGNRRKAISEDHLDHFINWLQEDPQVTLKQLKEKAILNLELDVSTSTISRCLHGMCYTVKKVHHEPINMNNPTNKQKRKTYVEKLQSLMENGNNKTI